MTDIRTPYRLGNDDDVKVLRQALDVLERLPARLYLNEYLGVNPYLNVDCARDAISGILEDQERQAEAMNATPTSANDMIGELLRICTNLQTGEIDPSDSADKLADLAEQWQIEWRG